MADNLVDQASTLYKAGRYGEALMICRRLNEQTPRRGDALLLQGMVYSRLGDPFKALESLAAALEVDQGNPRTLFHLAEVYLQTGSPVHALRSLRRLNNYWASDLKLRDLPDPRPLVEQLNDSMISEIGLVALDRDHQEVAMMAAERGRLRLLFQGDTRSAAREFRLAIRVAPHYPQARNNLSLTYFLEGHADKAMQVVFEVLEMHPDNVFAQALLAFYRYASGASAAECLPLAQSAAARLLADAGKWQEQPPRRPDVIKVAEVLNILGDDVACEHVLQMLPPNTPLLKNAVDGSEIARLALLASSIANQGRSEDALELLRSATMTFHDHFAKRLLDAIANDERLYNSNRFPGVSWDTFFAPATLARLSAPPANPRLALMPGQNRAVRPAQLQRTLNRLYPRLPEACAIMLWLGVKNLEELAITLLGISDTPAAESLLRSHLGGKLGSYSGRPDAGYALLDNNHLENGTVTRFWNGSEWGEVQIFRLKPKGRDMIALAAKLHSLAKNAISSS